MLPNGYELVLTPLEGGQEVPAITTTASGTAATTLQASTGWMRVHVNTMGVDDASAAHVHEALAGANGDVLVGLEQDASDVTHRSVDTMLDAAQLAAVQAGQTYVNVHTPANAGGELRGQIAPDGVWVIFTNIKGDQSVPPVAGDAGGIAATTLVVGSMQLDVQLNTTNLDDATAAHLHQGYAGANGGVLVGLDQDATNAANWSASAVLTAEQYEAIARGESYFNVHTPDNEPGEARGQLVPEGVALYFVDLDGAQEVPPVTTEATGRGAVTLGIESGALVANLHTTGVDDATAAHIHEGAAGENGDVLVGLTQDATDVTIWSVADTLTAEQVATMRSGSTYFNVHTPANEGGGIRGQIAN